MTSTANLNTIIGQAYKASVLHQTSIEAVYQQFAALAQADPAFVDAARAEQVRCASIPDKKCFVSAQAAAFLATALQRLEQGTHG